MDKVKKMTLQIFQMVSRKISWSQIVQLTGLKEDQLKQLQS